MLAAGVEVEQQWMCDCGLLIVIPFGGGGEVEARRIYLSLMH